jgi:hypothetical protein
MKDEVGRMKEADAALHAGGVGGYDWCVAVTVASASCRPHGGGVRKVRTAQGTVLANSKAEQSRFAGIKPTESATENTPPKPGFGRAGKGEKVR